VESAHVEEEVGDLQTQTQTRFVALRYEMFCDFVFGDLSSIVKCMQSVVLFIDTSLDSW
jgi:hypothetical protein